MSPIVNSSLNAKSEAKKIASDRVGVFRPWFHCALGRRVRAVSRLTLWSCRRRSWPGWAALTLAALTLKKRTSEGLQKAGNQNHARVRARECPSWESPPALHVFH